MTEDTQTLGLAGFRAELGEAEAALRAFLTECMPIPNEMAGEFERAAQRIAGALARAATGGEDAFKQMAKVILEELARVALARIFPQGGSGSRSAAGPIDALASSAAPSTGAVSVHFHFGGGADAGAIARHQGQIAAAVARAVAYGRRNL